MSAISPRRAMQWRDLNIALGTIGGEVKSFVAQELGRVLLRLAEAERELEQLKSKTLADSFKAVWQPATPYRRGDLVLWDGSPWIAMADTEGKPGTTDAWKLFCKRGKDGKDARP